MLVKRVFASGGAMIVCGEQLGPGAAVELSTEETLCTAGCSASLNERKFLILAQCPLFQNAAQEVLEEVAIRATELTFAPSAVLFNVGQPASEIYALGGGMVKLLVPNRDGTEALVQLVGAGELLGWTSLLSDGVHSAAGRAVGSVHVLVWQALEFGELLRKFPSLSHEALQVFARRLRVQEMQCCQLLSEQAPQRLARTLLGLTRSLSDHRKSGSAGEIPLSRIELAQLTGMSLFTVSRILSAWDDERIIRARREKVIVEDARALNRIAEAARNPCTLGDTE